MDVRPLSARCPPIPLQLLLLLPWRPLRPHPHLCCCPAAYPESLDSFPHSRHTYSWDSWDTDPTPLPQKLRLICSYDVHIVPRPHDKTLCYIGGNTRIIVIDHHTSLGDLYHRLSKTLLHNQPFSLKYQLPNEDLDPLISVTTDEDLETLVDEYDNLHNSTEGLKPGRLYLFLFPKASSFNIEQLLVETASTKLDDWFFNVLNGKTSNLSTTASRKAENAVEEKGSGRERGDGAEKVVDLGAAAEAGTGVNGG